MAFFGTGSYLLVRQIQATRYMAIESVVVDRKIIYENDPYKNFGPHSKMLTYYDIVEYEIGDKKYRKPPTLLLPLTFRPTILEN